MRRRGFTLAEVMMALLFLTIGLFAYVSLHMRLIHSGQKLEKNQKNREKLSVELSRDILTVVDAEAASPEDGPPTSGPLPYGEGVNGSDRRYPTAWSSLPVPKEVKQAEAEVTWSDRNGEQHLRCDTYILWKPYRTW